MGERFPLLLRRFSLSVFFSTSNIWGSRFDMVHSYVTVDEQD